MGRKIVVAMINIAVGLFTAYMFIVSDRETKISTTQSNINTPRRQRRLWWKYKTHGKSGMLNLSRLPTFKAYFLSRTQVDRYMWGE